MAAKRSVWSEKYHLAYKKSSEDLADFVVPFEEEEDFGDELKELVGEFPMSNNQKSQFAEKIKIIAPTFCPRADLLRLYDERPDIEMV